MQKLYSSKKYESMQKHLEGINMCSYFVKFV